MPLDHAKYTYSSAKHFLAKSIILAVDDNYFKQISLWLVSLTGYLLGENNYSLLQVLLVFIFVDWVTGIIAAYQNGISIKSSKLPRSGVKLIVYFFLISIAHLFGEVFQLPNIEKLLIAYYIATEALSIAENADKLGFPLPTWLQKAIKGKMEENDNEKL